MLTSHGDQSTCENDRFIAYLWKSVLKKKSMIKSLLDWNIKIKLFKALLDQISIFFNSFKYIFRSEWKYNKINLYKHIFKSRKEFWNKFSLTSMEFKNKDNLDILNAFLAVEELFLWRFCTNSNAVDVNIFLRTI